MKCSKSRGGQEVSGLWTSWTLCPVLYMGGFGRSHMPSSGHASATHIVDSCHGLLMAVAEEAKVGGLWKPEQNIARVVTKEVELLSITDVTARWMSMHFS